MSDELIISASSEEEAIEEAVHSWEIDASELVAEPVAEADDEGVTRYRVHRKEVVKTLDPTAARECMKSLFEAMEVEADFEDNLEEEYLHINVQSEDAGLLIGKYGRTLEALQLMMNLMVQKKDPDCGLRIVLNSAGYREKREDQLGELSDKAIDRVRKTRREYAFRPMSPIDRRIVHRHLLEVEGITTFSRGVGDNRYVVIAPVGENGEPLPSRGGGHRDHRGGYGGGRDRDRGDRGDRGRGRRDDRRGGGDRDRDRDRGRGRPRDDRPAPPRHREEETVGPIDAATLAILEGESLSGRLATGEATPNEVYSGSGGGSSDRPRGDRDRDRDRGRRDDRDRGGRRDDRRSGSGGGTGGSGGGTGGSGGGGGGGGGGRGRGRDRDQSRGGPRRGGPGGGGGGKRPNFSLPEDEPLWASEGPDPEFG